MLCREGDAEANASLQRQSTLSCKIDKLTFEISCCLHNICLQPCPRSRYFFGATNELLSTRLERCLVSRTMSVSVSRTCSRWWASSSSQRCCREWVSFSARLWTYGIREFLFFASFLILCDCRVDKCRSSDLSCSSVGLPHGGVVGFKDVRKS